MTRKRKAGARERRAGACELRAVQGGGDGGAAAYTIEGLAVAIGQEADLGYCREVMAPGCLDGADLRDVPLLVNHATERVPVARSRRNNGSSTMQLSVQPEGLRFSASLDVEGSPAAAELWSAVSRGDVSGMSFCFSTAGEEWQDEDTDSPLRTVTAIAAIYEVSAVTHPAYPQTELSARDIRALECARRALEGAGDASPPDGGGNDAGAALDAARLLAAKAACSAAAPAATTTTTTATKTTTTARGREAS
jgi:HK97 family phage prohead protease